MLPFSSTISNQIRFLLRSLSDSNFDSVLRELSQFVEYGSEGSILLLQTCLDEVNFCGGDTQSMQLRQNLVSAIFRLLMDRPNFSTVFCEALRAAPSEESLRELSKALNFSTSEKVAVGLALCDSENLDFKVRGQNFCMVQIEELCANPASKVSHGQIQNIVTFLSRSDGLAKHLDSFIKMLSLMQLKDSIPFVLSPMLTSEFSEDNSKKHLDQFFGCNENDFDAILAEIEKDINMADIMMELGYGCTVNASHCKEMLSLFLPLDEHTLSRILGTIVRTRSGLDDGQSTYSTFCSALGSSSTADSSYLNSWNVDVLVDSIKQLAPETNWTKVVESLDHEGLYFPDEDAFSLFMSIYTNACQDPFPLQAICGSIWKNAEGQISFLRFAVSVSPEIFTFSHSARQMPYFDATNGTKPMEGNANHAWSCLDLLEVFCQLAERGHASSIRTLLQNPLKQCPDVLLVGMAHIDTAFNLLQNEVFCSVFPSIVGNTVKSGVIHQLWLVNHNVVLQGFVDICSSEPETIVEIVDICQELKILSAVLEMAPFAFSVKLAVYASRKDYINLEKWLSENLSIYNDVFFEECLNFLQEISLEASNDASANPSPHSSAVLNSREMSSSIFEVLQAHSGQLMSHHLSEELKRLQAASVHASPRLQGGGVTESAPPDGYPDDIETEANAYFHQMFSGQLTIEAMVQMLARFKESSEQREQLIFECMIGNLFEEYKFFPKYPERQLKITAVLFGSLIKHQLVAHLTLGIALRAVLDALRKSVDSKMFAFGAKALEQFVDRLVEWPQYCNHILQISHLRGTHAELVAFIERALARISSGQTESNGGSSAPTDQHQSSTQSNMENIEASEASWPLIGYGTKQSGQQLPSPFPIQQKHQGLLDDRQKAFTVSGSLAKPLLSSGQSSLGTAGVDSASSQKSVQIASTQHSASLPSTVSSSHGFLRVSRGITSAGMLRQPLYNTGFGSALNIETLVAAAERRDTPIEVPSSEIQDKILFMINNISISNMEAKAKEFTEVLKEQYYPWFAQYMVMKRASIEPNFHDLYLKFLEKVNSRVLNKEIEKATIENCKVLLRSELIKSSSEERSLLKNLGSWLGKITIGRNLALRARDIDPKMLIIEAYEKGLMIAVIPFTSKILEPCQSSLAYQPPNPWTMAILSLLAEIYALPNLKMNLKFDIEVLFKNLIVNMKDVKPTSLLKDRVREIEGNPDFSNKDISVSQAQSQVVAEANTGMVSTLSQVELQSELTNPSLSSGNSNYAAPLHLASSSLGDDEKIGTMNLSERIPSAQGLSQFTPPQSPFPVSQLPTIPNIGTHVVVNQKLNAGLQMQFQRILPVAMERAIREIVSPVVQRSVTIASRTTKDLVLKDYAMEIDESRIYNAAHLMVASLAGSLAHVTCKEPLRVALSNQLRSFLQSLNVAAELLEHAVQLVTNDNLDLGCAVIEEAATGRALQSIDRDISQSLDKRRKQREGLGSAFYDASTYSKSPFASLPEALRPKPGHVSNTQQRVYEDFVRFPWQNQSTQSSNAVTAAMPGSSGGSASSGISRVYGSSSGQSNSNMYSGAQMASGFSTVPQPSDLIPEGMDSSSPQFLSATAAHVGATDGVIQHTVDINSAASFPSTAAISDVHVMENTSVMKESGATVLSSPATSVTERLESGISDPSLTTGDALDKYHIFSQKLESLVSNDARDAEIQGVITEVPEILLKCISRDEAALAVAQKVFKSLYENASNSVLIASYLAILATIRDVCKLVVKELTSWVIYSDEERKFNKDISIGLIRSELLNLAEYNVHLAKLTDGGRNKAATDFAISLIQTLMVQEPGVVSELPNLIDALAKISMRTGTPDSLQQLVEIARNPTASAIAISGINIGKEDKTRSSRDKKVTSGHYVGGRDDASISDSIAADPAGFHDQVSLLFSEWCRISEHPGTPDTAYPHYISQLQQSGLLKGDDITDRFFRIVMEISVAHCVASELINPGSLSSPQVQSMSFIAIDMFAKLVFAILKYCGVDQGSNKVVLLPKILAVTVRVIQKDAEEKKASFNPRPYFRLFVSWIFDIGSPDPVFDGANFQILTSFANAFHALQPLKVPSFSFAWLELVSHRIFMPKLLMSNSQKGWPFIQRLIVNLFKFMEPYLRNAELGEPVHFLYKGTLRVLLVLLHDFPEFLCDYHFSFCDVIPPSCIQMRNVILSAFPRNMRLPDPSTPNLKIDLLAEISQSPRILSEVDGALKAKQMKTEVDEYLKTRQQGSPFLTELKQKLVLNPSEAQLAGTKYNVLVINSLVLYVGMQAIQQLQSRPATPPHVATNSMDVYSAGAVMDIFQMLVGDLDTEGRYLFLNAVANQLRYPNNHTHYFSFILLYLFAEAKQEIVQEQITRVLLERLIVNRPHPWGLLITFIELIKNPRYNFWNRSFTRCAPEIERLFESVSRSCGGPKAVDDGMVPGGIPDNTH